MVPYVVLLLVVVFVGVVVVVVVLVVSRVNIISIINIVINFFFEISKYIQEDWAFEVLLLLLLLLPPPFPPPPMLLPFTELVLLAVTTPLPPPAMVLFAVTETGLVADAVVALLKGLPATALESAVFRARDLLADIAKSGMW